ncbi:hypothetical protein FACS1894164_01220 [Spirochaetia bacterium]|nr:hypothetical protein FACS1894164_01220 [Spirochaetia bacterium]
MFKIKEEIFDIEYVCFDAWVSEERQLLIFSLKVRGQGKENIFAGSEPSFNSEILLTIKPGEIKNWQDIAGKIVEWDDFPDDEDEPHALFYICEHEPVYNTKIEFKKLNGKMVVKIKSSCDINWDDEYADNVPLEIETEINFFGILCGTATEEECKNEIKPYLEIENFKYIKNKYGVSLLIPKDSNIETNLLAMGEY